MSQLVIGVDVGTQSARAGVFDRHGNMLARAQAAIALHRPAPDHAEHDSEDIWRAVCAAVRGALAHARAAPEQVGAIAFDATCSLVVRSGDGKQVSVSQTGESRWDTIVWLDHRAAAEAARCTASAHRVLEFIGGVMSPEMQIPKLMWLKRHLPESWARAGKFFDLADFLTWKASGSNARSQCTLVCKWTYLAGENPGWQHDFLRAMGVGDVLEVGDLAAQASPIGADLGALSAVAAEALGLTTRCRVATGLIDAHAGALALLGKQAGDLKTINRAAALIAGTSTCLMALSTEPRSVFGVWGPYFGAVLPGVWLNEGGQSATGALLDHVIALHSAGGEPTPERHRAIIERITQLRAVEGVDFARRLHVLPDFHGNRSPLADASALGVISGLDLDTSFDSLCRLYWRACVGVALGVRHIIAALNAQGYAIDTLHVAGGHCKNPLLMELYADATECTVVAAGTEDAVLLGTAIAAAPAAGLYRDLFAAAANMSQHGAARTADPATVESYATDYSIFLAMHEQRRALDALITARK